MESRRGTCLWWHFRSSRKARRCSSLRHPHMRPWAPSSHRLQAQQGRVGSWAEQWGWQVPVTARLLSAPCCKLMRLEQSQAPVRRKAPGKSSMAKSWRGRQPEWVKRNCAFNYIKCILKISIRPALHTETSAHLQFQAKLSSSGFSSRSQAVQRRLSPTGEEVKDTDLRQYLLLL